MKNLHVHIDVCKDTYLRDPSASELGRKIISESIELIDALGFEGFTFKKLGKKIGSPESSVYRYFESKHMVLIYLTAWYWSWTEYKLVFAIANLSVPKQKLKKAIAVLTEPVETDSSFSHINEILLDRIIMNEGVKTYHVKEIDEENKKGYFEVYKRVVQRVSNMMLELNPNFEFPHMLATTIIEGAHQQRYFASHLASLTDIKRGENSVSKFYSQLAFGVLEL